MCDGQTKKREASALCGGQHFFILIFLCYFLCHQGKESKNRKRVFGIISSFELMKLIFEITSNFFFASALHKFQTSV